MLCVIIIHLMQDVPPTARGLWIQLVMSVCQAAVPMFFVAAGYFLRSDGGDLRDAITKPFGRLMPVFLFWVVVYQLVAMMVGNWFWPGIGSLAMGGVAYHLWFLPALGFALALNGALQTMVGRRSTLAIVLALALFGLMRGSYGAALGLVSEESRGGTLSAPLLVAVGGALTRHPLRIRLPWTLALLAGFVVLQVGENIVIDVLLGAPLWTTRSFTLVSFGLGVAAFLVAQSIEADRLPVPIVEASRVTLGVYAVHLMFLWLVVAVVGPPSGVGSLLVEAIVILLLATIAAIALYRVAWLRRVVS